ncbi:MAG: NfeD family protein [Bacteroidetes bacterium]|nr:NfeD family protein [Bacteroidota bacterium]MCL2303018.1 NfeD family protein [Lentimicrobiaceae bacterium]
MLTFWLAAILIILIVGTIFFFRYKTWKPLMLKTEIDSKVNVLDKNITVGMEGKTVSRLAPAGKAIFEGITEEVFSQNDFIDENQQVVIAKIEGSKIIVKLKK